jgi:hypothetical protein
MKAAAKSEAANLHKGEEHMTWTKKMALGTLAALTIAAVTGTVAFSSTSPAPFRTWYTSVSLVTATVDSFDFGYDSVAGKNIGVQPTTVQINTFILHHGAASPWHYHKALSFVAIQGGTVTEQHLNSDGSCSAPETISAGGGFTEAPEFIHDVVNVGAGDALITWSTAYPSSDPPLAISPEFTVGGIYPVQPPNCN